MGRGLTKRLGGPLRLALLAVFCAGAMGSLSARQEPAPRAADRRRAEELMEQARRAAGIAPAFANLRTFSAGGKSRRFIKYASVQSPTKVVEKEKVLSGKLEMDFALPDKFRLRIKGASLTGFGFSYEEIVNGEQAWRNPPMSVRSFNRDQRIIDVGDVERTLLMQARTARQQIAFHSLGWLAVSPSSFPLDLTYQGVYRTEGREYETILAESQEGLRVILLLDRQTRLLTGIVVTFVDTYREAVVVEVASLDRRVIGNTYARAREERRRRTQPRQNQEVIWRFSDHRPVAGILVPHRATILFNRALIEEISIDKVKINEPINPKRFAGKEEVKY